VILAIDMDTHWARAAYLNEQGEPQLVPTPEGQGRFPALARQTLQGLEVGPGVAHALAGNAETTLRGCTRLLGRANLLPPEQWANCPIPCAWWGARSFAACSMRKSEPEKSTGK
jgi:hypothetical protein